MPATALATDDERAAAAPDTVASAVATMSRDSRRVMTMTTPQPERSDVTFYATP